LVVVLSICEICVNLRFDFSGMYLPELNALFVHIPKVAGNSIKQALGVSWEDHKDLTKYREELGEESLAGLYKFAFVRNPWDRVLSEYNFQRKKSQRKDTVRLWLHKADGSEREFAEWVEHTLENPREHQPRQWGGKPSDRVHRMSPQVDWLSLDGEIGVDFVGRLENLQEGFDQVCAALGVEHKKLKKKNRKLHWHYSRYYDDPTRERVGAYYQRDVEEFGYSF
jgi:hypothetical protein